KVRFVIGTGRGQSCQASRTPSPPFRRPLPRVLQEVEIPAASTSRNGPGRVVPDRRLRDRSPPPRRRRRGASPPVTGAAVRPRPRARHTAAKRQGKSSAAPPNGRN